MSARAYDVRNVAAAALLIGGALGVVFPHQLPNLARLVVLTSAAAAGLWALATHVPQSGWISPYRWLSPFDPARAVRDEGRSQTEVDAIQSTFRGRRQRIPNGPPLPPATLRLLNPLIAAALEPHLDEDAAPGRAQDLLSTRTWSLLVSDPIAEPAWWATLKPDEASVATVVHDVLDELDRLTDGAPLSSHATTP